MKVLVTGGTGFTGGAVARRFLARGDTVRVLDTKRGDVFDELRAKGAELVTGSIEDPQTVRAAVAGCDLVLHVAAAFREVTAPARLYHRVNVEGTRILGEESLRAGVRRFIYTSTEGVHGHVRNPPADEDGPIEPADVYQETKWLGEVAIREIGARGLPLVILRPTGIYGPGDPGRFLLLFRQVNRGRFYVVGDGRATYHPVYIDNLVDAFELASDRDSALGGTFLIGDDRYVSWNDLLPLVARTMGVDLRVVRLPFWPVWIASALCEAAYRPFGAEPPVFRRRAEMFSHVRAFDISRARKVLGYEPRVSLEDGLARTHRWYRDNGYL